MCKALEDLLNKGRSEGQELSVLNLIAKGKLSLEDGAEELGISVDALREKLA